MTDTTAPATLEVRGLRAQIDGKEVFGVDGRPAEAHEDCEHHADVPDVLPPPGLPPRVTGGGRRLLGVTSRNGR